jgi:hypothetical protein
MVGADYAHRRTGRAIRAYASDLADRSQPEWNRLGYGSNFIQEAPVHVREQSLAGIPR